MGGGASGEDECAGGHRAELEVARETERRAREGVSWWYHLEL